MMENLNKRTLKHIETLRDTDKIQEQNGFIITLFNEFISLLNKRSINCFFFSSLLKLWYFFMNGALYGKIDSIMSFEEFMRKKI